jgi:putative transposase
MIAFIDDHREVYGVEPICKVLPIAPSTYHAHIAQRIDPTKRSARAQRDAELKIEVQRVFAENFGVYGARRSGGSCGEKASRLPAAPSSG